MNQSLLMSKYKEARTKSNEFRAKMNEQLKPAKRLSKLMQSRKLAKKMKVYRIKRKISQENRAKLIEENHKRLLSVVSQSIERMDSW